MPDVNTTATGGVQFRTYRRGAATTDGGDQYVVPVEDKVITFTGRGSSFRIPGRAGAVGQPLATVWNGNAAGSGLLLDLDFVTVDLAATAAKIVLPPVIRMHRITTIPTGGAVLPKVADNTAAGSSANVTLLQDASADQTSAATALAATPAAGTQITQEYASRLLTVAGAEVADRIEMLSSGAVTLQPQQGVVLFLSYTAATQNPITDTWIVGVHFKEYTRP